MLFSIITPCYKSERTLRRTYESLLKQKTEEFEWILVDDASPDNGKTRELIEQLAEEAPFKVLFKFLPENYFGSRSTYEATLIATGDYSCILDHDDELAADALVNVRQLISEYNVAAIKNLAGVTGRCINEKGNLIGPEFGRDSFIANEGDIRFKKRITAELFQFTKTELLRDYFKGIKPGYTNGYCWAKISEKFDYVFSDRIIRVYDTYNPESYTNKYKRIVVFPENKQVAVMETIKAYRSYLKYNPIYSIKLCASFIRHAFLSGGCMVPKGMPLFFYLTLPATIPLGWLKSKNII